MADKIKVELSFFMQATSMFSNDGLDYEVQCAVENDFKEIIDEMKDDGEISEEDFNILMGCSDDQIFKNLTYNSDDLEVDYCEEIENDVDICYKIPVYVQMSALR